MIKEEIKNIDQSPKTLKKFGITFGVIFVLIGVYGLYHHASYGIWSIVAGGVFMVAAFIAAMFLKPLNLIWMTLAVILGWFMSRFILSIIYYLVLTPIGVILRLSKKDLLSTKRRGNPATYWIERKSSEQNSSGYEKQF